MHFEWGGVLSCRIGILGLWLSFASIACGGKVKLVMPFKEQPISHLIDCVSEVVTDCRSNSKRLTAHRSYMNPTSL